MQLIRGRGIIHPSQFINPDYQGMEVKSMATKQEDFKCARCGKIFFAKKELDEHTKIRHKK
jgi:hypothetical protein